jgi:HAMP domain-containing protein
MRFKAKILWILLGVCLLVVLVGARAISRQRAVGILEASSEAEEDARVLAFIVASDHDPAHAISEKVSRYMYETLGRDVEVVDTHKRVIADAIPAEVGGMSDHGGDALDQTLRDGRVRTSFETNPARPRGMRLIMAPVTTESGQVAGAVTEEYTPIYNEFMAITEATTRQVVYAALAGVVVSVLLALYIGRSIAAPLRQLTGAAVGFAAGQTGLSLPPSRNDEIGDLTVAFNVMMERRQQAQEALVQARDELGQANAQLQIEVSERRLAEETARQGEESPENGQRYGSRTDAAYGHSGQRAGYGVRELVVGERGERPQFHEPPCREDAWVHPNGMVFAPGLLGPRGPSGRQGERIGARSRHVRRRS